MAAPREPFDDFFVRYHPRVVRFAAAVFGSSEADDVAQETMIRAYRSYERLDADRDPWPWLTVVARHVAHSGHESRRRLVLGYDATVEAWNADIADTVEERDLVQSALARLSANERDVLLLREWHDVPIADLSRLLGVTPNAVRQQVFRARRRLAHAYTTLGGRAVGLVAAVAARVAALRARTQRAVEAMTALPATQLAAAIAAGATGAVLTLAPTTHAATGPAALGDAAAGPARRTSAPTRLVRTTAVAGDGTTTARATTGADRPRRATVRLTHADDSSGGHHAKSEATTDYTGAWVMGDDSRRRGDSLACVVVGIACGQTTSG